MKNKGPYLIVILMLVVAAVIVVMLILNADKVGNNLRVNGTRDREMDILNKLKLTYSDNWAVINNGTAGVELSNADQVILITTLQVDENSTLEEIINERNNELQSSKKILSDDTVDINGISFRRLEYGNLNEENFPSDGLIVYSTLIDRVYLTLIINFPPSGNPTDAESIVKTIRYN